MATALSQQLAAIAQNSTHQLDLKAQKQRHSKSLLFPHWEASRQSFDHIFSICVGEGGFEDLCSLDKRFRQFESNLFAGESVTLEREGLTATENERVDGLIRSFLQLVQPRLQLLPALRAVEWIVRRWRVHEHAPADWLLTFLPYHTSDVFATALSLIQAKNLPVDFAFLRPYIGAGHLPPRHAIIAAVVKAPSLLTSLSRWVLDSAGKGYASASLVGFWTGIGAQGIAAQLDNANSSRVTVLKEKTEQVLLRVLPSLEEALQISKSKENDELYLGVLLLITILGTKAHLSESAVHALMLAVIMPWSQNTQEEAISCLAILASNLDANSKLPAAVVKKLYEDEKAVQTMKALQDKGQDLQPLALKIALMLVEHASRDDKRQSSAQSFVQQIAATKLLNVQSWQKLSNAMAQESLAIENVSLLLLDRDSINDDNASDQVNAMEIDEVSVAPTRPTISDVNAALDKLQQLPTELQSFLGNAIDNELFQSYAHIFVECSSDDKALDALLQLPTMRYSQTPVDDMRIITFLARLWTTPSLTAQARAIALGATVGIITRYIKAHPTESLDFQLLLPYVIAGLSDASQKVREEACQLVNAISEAYHVAPGSKDKIPNSIVIVGRDTFYGQNDLPSPFLSSQEAFAFISNGVQPVCADCVLDPNFLLRHLQATLNGEDGEKHLKSALRSSICSAFAGHVAATPSTGTKVKLLEIIAGVGKTASDARRNILVPNIKFWLARSTEELLKATQATNTQLTVLDEAYIRTLSPRSADEIALLKRIASGEIGNRPGLIGFAFRQLGRLFGLVKEGSQVTLLDFIMTTANDESKDEVAQSEALETVRRANLSAHLLAHLINQVISSTADLKADAHPPSKRRRTSFGRSPGNSFPDAAAGVMRTVRIVTQTLELVESNKEGKNRKLTRPLFQLLGELRTMVDISGSELVYATQLLLTALNAVVLTPSSNSGAVVVEESSLRSDLVVDLIRNTSSPVIHTSALRLMSSLASWKPEIVLHSVMPLFTFATNSVMTRSDELSGSVGEDAIEKIVGALAKSLRGKKGVTILEGASELLLSFVAAWEHIPLHRRESLFSKLAETLGTENVLGGILASLLGRYQSSGQNGHKVARFAVDMLARFEIGVQVTALKQYLDVIIDVATNTHATASKRVGHALLGLDENANRESIQSKVEGLLKGLTDVVNIHSTLEKRLNKAFNKNESSTEAVRRLFTNVMEQTLALSTSTDVKIGSMVIVAAQDLVVALTAPLPALTFLEVATRLASKGTPAMHQSLLRMLERRAAVAKPGSLDGPIFMENGLDFCCAWIGSESEEDINTDTRHAAISCIDTVSEKFGKAHVSKTLEAARAVAGPLALGSAHHHLKVMSMLTMATLIGVLGEAFTPLLPPSMKVVLKCLAESASDESENAGSLRKAAVAFVTAALDNLPWLVSQQNIETAMKLVVQAEPEIGNASNFFTLVARKSDPVVCFSALNHVLQGVISIGAFTDTLQTFVEAVRYHSKKTIIANAQRIFPVLLSAFDAPRRWHLKDEEAPLETIEFINQATMEVVLKLNDATFRPFFIRLVEWTEEADVADQIVRKQSLYSFALTLSEQLKSLVTGYTSFLLEPASKTLRELHPSFSPQELGEDRVQNAQLLDVLLQYLTSSFTNDADNYWANPVHFSAVVEPLLALIEITTPLSSIDNGNLTDRVIATLIAFASAGSMEQVREISQTLLVHMRDSEAARRLAAVKVQRGITEAYEEDWLEMLPETLPAISELLEDDDEQVERETLKWVKVIEEVTGESVSGMLG